LEAAGFADREQPLDCPVAVVGLGAVAGLAPQHAVAERSFRGVVRGRDAGDAGERPQRVVALKQSCAEPGGPLVMAAAALLEQRLEPLTAGRKVGPQSGQVFAVTFGLVEDLERVGEAPLKLAPEAARRAGAFRSTRRNL
jgi:hypothetical protein